MRPYGRHRIAEGSGREEWSEWAPVGLNVRYMREDFKEFYRKESVAAKKEEFFLTFEFEMEAEVEY